MPSRTTRRAVDTITLGRRRRARAMNKRLAELDRIEFGVEPVRRRRPSSTGTLFVVLVLLVVGGLAVWESVGHKGGVGKGLVAAGAEMDPSGTQQITGAPTATHLRDHRRLLPAVTAAPSSRSYRFLYGSRAMRWEPCRPIRYVIRHGDEPRTYDRMLKSAIAEVSRATGLEFIAEGSTAEIPPYDGARRAYQPSTYGDRWAPVLIAWSNSGENPRLVGATEGVAGPIPWGSDSNPMRYVSGQVSYNVDGLNILRRQPDGVAMVRTVLLHELGHLVGLAHVHDTTQVMNASVGPGAPSHFAGGDLTGLAELGTGPCFADY